MASLTSGAYPPALKDEELSNLVQTIKDWSIGNGLAIRPPPAVISAEADPKGIAAVTAPVTLFPSPFPRLCFDQGRTVQKAYNELYAAVSRDEEFLAQIVKECGILTMAVLRTLTVIAGSSMAMTSSGIYGTFTSK